MALKAVSVPAKSMLPRDGINASADESMLSGGGITASGGQVKQAWNVCTGSINHSVCRTVEEPPFTAA
jgi:hypothetical protein